MTTQIAPIVGPQAAQKSVLTIQKATVKKQLLTAEFTEQLTLEAKPREFTMNSTELVHPDLERCFAQLVPHFCLLTEQIEEGADYWPEDTTSATLPTQFSGYGVTGLILSSKASGGVTLMGFRTLESGKVLNLTGQFVSFAEPSEEFTEADGWHYRHTQALQELVQDALAEVDAALRGKCSEAGRQLEIFDKDQNREEVIAEFGEVTKDFVAPKKRKARRIAQHGADTGANNSAE